MNFIFKDIYYFLLAWFSYLQFNLKGVRVQPSCKIDPGAKLSPQSSFFGNSVITKNVKIGRYTYATDAIIQNAIIGAFCSIAPGAKIGLNNHPLDQLLTHPMGYDSLAYNSVLPQVIMGNDVWVGANAVIFNGVIIGDGAVIAAGAVVIKNVASFSIVGGIPAREIGKRIKPTQFDELMLADDETLKEILALNRPK